MASDGMDLFVSAIEINDHHGVGILLRRYFPDSSRAISLRSTTLHNGEEPFGAHHWELFSRHMTVAETEARLREMLSSVRVRRILAVPYFREDFVHALLAKRITGAPLCGFIMDDQNVFAPEVPDHWVKAFLEAADLRLGISPELCEAYRRKFGVRLDVMPPVLPKGSAPVPNYWIPGRDEPPVCAMVGNVWTKPRFERLRAAIRGAGIRVHWFGNGPKASWLGADPAELERDGIEVMGFLPEPDLARLLGSYPVVIVPTGELNDDDDNPAFSRLSLPSRVLFVAARANVPILVIGHGETAAGRFVRRLRIGNCCGYTPDSLLHGLKHLTEPARRARQCANLLRCSEFLTHDDPGGWIWRSLDGGRALDAPWCRAFAPRRTWYGRSLERPPHLEIVPRKDWAPTPVPGRWEDVKAADLPSFGFSRASHLPLACPGASGAQLEDVEAGTLMAVLAANLASRIPRGPADLLFVDGAPENALRAVPEGCRVWRVGDIPAWLAAGCPAGREWLAAARPGPSAAAAPDRFDAVVSTGIGNHIRQEDTEAFRRFAAFAAGSCRPGGLQAHAFVAILNPGYFWVHPLASHLRSEAGACPGRRLLDEILSTPDTWFMAPRAYAAYWEPNTKVPYSHFGRILGCLCAWVQAEKTPS